MDRICIHCGRTVGETDTFCSYCGYPLVRTEARNIPPQNPNMNQGQSVKKPNTDAPLSMADYLLIGLLMMIPVVNLIILLIWVFDKNTNTNRRNLAKASLIFMGIGIVLTAILTVGMIRALSLDDMNYREFEYYIEHPEFDEWIDYPFDVNEV